MRKHPPTLCLVIPCYNEVKRLQPLKVRELQKRLHCFIIFIDDGSNDDTVGLLSREFGQSQNYMIMNSPKNEGKSRALYKGLIEAVTRGYEMIGYFDADSAVDVDDYKKAKELLESNECIDLVSGARVLLAGSRIARPNSRKWIGRIIATYISLLIGQDYYDPQTPCKLFRRSYVSGLNKPSTRWFLDAEIFLSRRARYDISSRNVIHVVEFPLSTWNEVGGSSISSKQFFGVFKDLLVLTLRRFLFKNHPDTKTE